MAQKKPLFFRFIRRCVKAVYPKIGHQGLENIPNEPVIIVGNHSQMNGPIACELYTPGEHSTWCVSNMMFVKEVPSYAYQDFWSQKPKLLRPFYKVFSYLIAPLAAYIFTRADTIPVYHDSRILATFKKTVTRLEEGANIVIFPEDDTPRNQIINEFRDKFIDVAKLYYKRTGKEICFVPMYLAPKLRTMYFGSPIRYCATQEPAAERKRICQHLMEEITAIACSLPEHTVVPFNNVPKDQYPTNRRAGTVNTTCAVQNAK